MRTMRFAYMTRKQVLIAISKKAKSVEQIAKELNVSTTSVHKHLKVLRNENKIHRDHFTWPATFGGKTCFWKAGKE